jgi:hypothetical protein
MVKTDLAADPLPSCRILISPDRPMESMNVTADSGRHRGHCPPRRRVGRPTRTRARPRRQRLERGNLPTRPNLVATCRPQPQHPAMQPKSLAGDRPLMDRERPIGSVAGRSVLLGRMRPSKVIAKALARPSRAAEPRRPTAAPCDRGGHRRWMHGRRRVGIVHPPCLQEPLPVHNRASW